MSQTDATKLGHAEASSSGSGRGTPSTSFAAESSSRAQPPSLFQSAHTSEIGSPPTTYFSFDSAATQESRGKWRTVSPPPASPASDTRFNTPNSACCTRSTTSGKAERRTYSWTYPQSHTASAAAFAHSETTPKSHVNFDTSMDHAQ
ncbi:hypothetical protein C8R45DRAFT_1104634 [Mycena sanguinolenta]|nr:hypothetical protein C8R45DRAFT_1104634 [Mycena sanguinolenta]